MNQYAHQLTSDRLNTNAQSAAVAAFMGTVYRYMAAGLGVTAVTAYYVASTPAILEVVLGNSIVFYGLLIAQLVMVVAFSKIAQSATTAVAAAAFLGYAALTGLTFSVIFIVYTASSIAQTFFITAGAFAALSLYGSITKRDLSAMGRFMFVGLIGLIIASVANIFLASPAIYWISTYAGVLIFAGLTAYENQKLRAMFTERGAGGNLALQGALVFYLDFINLFLMLLRIFGGRRD